MWLEAYKYTMALSCRKLWAEGSEKDPQLWFGRLGLSFCPLVSCSPEKCCELLVCQPHFHKWSLEVRSCNSNSLSHVHLGRLVKIGKYARRHVTMSNV